jgi:hypothetical protein
MTTRSLDETIALRANQARAACDRATDAWQDVAGAAMKAAMAAREDNGKALAAARAVVAKTTADAERASADLVQARSLLKRAVTRRDTAAARAGSPLMPLSVIKRTLDEALNAGRVNGLDPYFALSLSERGGSRKITVKWTGRPSEDVVRNRVTEILARMSEGADQHLTVVYERTLLWSCGHVHDDAEDAFLSHEAEEQGMLVWDDFEGDHVLPRDVREDLEAEDGLVSRFVPGNYATCPLCGGLGGSVAYRQTWAAHRGPAPYPAYEPCTACGDAKILDLDDTDSQARFEDAAAQVRVLVAEREQKDARAARRAARG